MTASLTFKYPTNFHVAQFTSGTTTQQSRRRPKYINPSSGSYKIDIFINGTDVISTSIAPSQPDGTQSFTIPLYFGQDEIVAVETEAGLQGGNGTILAIGETDVDQNYIASPITLSLTMQQNLQYIGLMTSTTGTNASIGSTFNPPQCVSQGSHLTVYPFAADPTGGFSLDSGAGGSPIPSLMSFTDPSPFGIGGNFDTVSGPTSGQPGYTVTYTSSAGEAALGTYFAPSLNFSVLNPAAAIYADVIAKDNGYGGGAYPGIEQLYTQTQKIVPIQSLSTITPFTATISVTPNENGC